MTTETMRKFVKIDEAKCNGCGDCIPACAEGALKIINGKAKLISELHCDGLGACLAECPQGAITVEERVAAEFDEDTAKHFLRIENQDTEELPYGCPSAKITQFEKHQTTVVTREEEEEQRSMLSHWPIQLTLVPPTAPFLQGADLLIVADCVPFAYAGFHQDFLKGHALLVACPKLDDCQAHLKILADILTSSGVKSITVVRMEVPCCSGLVHMSKQAMKLAGKVIPLKEVTIGIKGDLKPC
jgi:ferredoxin